MRRDPQDNARALYQIAAAQGGYFTTDQANEAGYAYSQQHFHVRRGNWLKIERGLFRLRGFPPVEREDLIRWSLWSHNRKGIPQAVVSHETALAVHGLSDVMPERVHLTMPQGFRKRIPAGCTIHRDSLSDEEVEHRSGYQVTTPLRTLLDVADSALSQEHLNKAVSDALGQGLVRREVLETAPCTPAAHSRLEEALAAARQWESRL